MKAVLITSHGSQSPKTKQEVIELQDKFKGKSDYEIFEHAFLEIESPSIPDGIALCVERGATEVLVLLNFLNSGKHVDEDIPAIINEQKKRYPNISFKISKPIGQHERIIELFLDMLF